MSKQMKEEADRANDISSSEEEEENQSDILSRLEQYGKQFLIDFDDYSSSDEQPQQQQQEEEEQVNQQVEQSSLTTKQSKTTTTKSNHTSSSDSNSGKNSSNNSSSSSSSIGPTKKPSAALVEKKGKVTIFNGDHFAIQDQEETHQSIGHRSLDRTEEEAALTVTDLKRLKRKRHEMEESERQEKSKDYRKLKKGPAFDIENNRNISRKNERQRELDKLTYDIKSFVNYSTLKGDDFNKQHQEEMRLQGKAFQKVKSKAMNYKQLKDKIQQDKINHKRDIKEAKENGTFDKKKFAKELIRDKKVKEAQKYRFLARHGAPSDIGKADKRLRGQVGVGTVGQWQKGQLLLTKKDIKSVTKKRKN